MKPIQFRPTNFIIKENAINGLKAAKDVDAYFLAVESINNRVCKMQNNRQSQGVVEAFKNLFRTQSRLDVVLDKAPKGQFVLRVERKLNDLKFLGKTVPIDLEKVVKSKKYLDKIILQSKESILEQINQLNYNRKNLKLPKIR